MGLFPAVVVSFAAGFLAGRRAWLGALADGLLALVVVALDGVVYALGQGTLDALLYRPCPPNERCAIRGPWSDLVAYLPSSIEVSLWLGVTVGLILIATGVLRPRARRGGTVRTRRRAGSAKGLISMAEDFDEPLADFDEHTN